jgi:hypothetical protein
MTPQLIPKPFLSMMNSATLSMAVIMQRASLSLAGLAQLMWHHGPHIAIRLAEIISMIQMKSVMTGTTWVKMGAHKGAFKLKYLTHAH